MKNNYFGHNLKFLRKSFNLSQQQMARIVGKTFTAVSRWEAGLREPSNKVVQTYAEHFGLTPADLMYRPIDEQVKIDERSDIFKLLTLVNQMDENQFARLLAFREGLCRSTK